LLIKNQ